jgi:hypothetical protein
MHDSLAWGCRARADCVCSRPYRRRVLCSCMQCSADIVQPMQSVCKPRNAHVCFVAAALGPYPSTATESSTRPSVTLVVASGHGMTLKSQRRSVKRLSPSCSAAMSFWGMHPKGRAPGARPTDGSYTSTPRTPACEDGPLLLDISCNLADGPPAESTSHAHALGEVIYTGPVLAAHLALGAGSSLITLLDDMKIALHCMFLV